ncbi:MAG: hypothetical protein M3Y41_19505 [Pseudomonadota bacterium]|nr:hypothetical protein [Pseudomonadota bacterium]
MTLTRYLTMYLYNPISLWVARRRAARGSATGRRLRPSVGGFAATVLLPTFVTMTLAGIWHGSGLTFLVFGLLHAIYLSINHAWRMFRPAACKPGSGLTSVAGRVLLTYLCVLAGSVVFRAASMPAVLQLLGGMIGLHGVSLRVPAARAALAGARDAVMIAGLYAVVWAAPNTQQIMRAYTPVLGKVAAARSPRLAWRPSLGWAMAFGSASALGLLAIGGTGEFLYFRF